VSSTYLRSYAGQRVSHVVQAGLLGRRRGNFLGLVVVRTYSSLDVFQYNLLESGPARIIDIARSIILQNFLQVVSYCSHTKSFKVYSLGISLSSDLS
jgi:hypothetical protein